MARFSTARSVTARIKGSDKSIADKKKEDQKKKPEESQFEETKNTSAANDLEEVVFVLQKDGKVKKTIVKSGIQDINYIEIVSGLKEGDEVVTDPYTAVTRTLKDGTVVNVVAKDKLFQK